MRYRKPKRQKKGVERKPKPEIVKTKETKFDKAIEKVLGKGYEKRVKKEEKSGLFYYVLKQLGLRK